MHARPMETTAFLAELEPVTARLLDRHLAQAKEWFPHQLVPYSRGRDFDDDYEWSPEDTALSDEVRSSLFVNLLTEDNLPYYFRTIEAMFGRESAWGEWSRRWTAEEGRHSIVIRDYLTVTRALDPVALERARMAQVACGQVPEPETPQEGLVYVALQELATRISHHNTGKVIEDPVGYEVMKRVASDENRHHLFYRDLCTAALEVDPSGMVAAIEKQVREFEMPGTGIVDFDAPRPRHRQGRHLRLPDPPRPDPVAGRRAPLGHREPDRAQRRRRAGPRRAPHAHPPHPQGRRAHGPPPGRGPRHRAAASPPRSERRRPEQRRAGRRPSAARRRRGGGRRSRGAGRRRRPRARAPA